MHLGAGMMVITCYEHVDDDDGVYKDGRNNANYLEDVHVHLVSIEVGIIRGCDLVVMIIRFSNSAHMEELGTCVMHYLGTQPERTTGKNAEPMRHERKLVQ